MRALPVVIGIVIMPTLALAFSQDETDIFASLHEGLNLNLVVLFFLGVVAGSLLILAGLYACVSLWKRSSSSSSSHHQKARQRRA